MDTKTINLVSPHKGDEGLIDGEELMRRARELEGVLGQEDAEYFLEYQDEIPKEFRGNILLFPKTVRQDRYGKHRITFLEFYENRWLLGLTSPTRDASFSEISKFVQRT